MGVAVPALDARMMPTARGDNHNTSHAQAGSTESVQDAQPTRPSPPASLPVEAGPAPNTPFKKKGQPPPLTNQTIQSQSLSKNQNQDHTHKQLGLLGIGPVKLGRGGVWGKAYAAGHQDEHGPQRCGIALPCRAARRAQQSQQSFTPRHKPRSTGTGPHLTPASPTMPMAMPAPRPARPQARPPAKCA